MNSAVLQGMFLFLLMNYSTESDFHSFLPITPMHLPHEETLTAQVIVDRIKSEVTCEWEDPTVDLIKAGDPNTVITGIATTFLATMEVLKKAKSEGLNMIITHEPTFYNHLDDREPLANSWVQEEKLRFLKENGMVVFRFHDFLHRTDPDGINEGLIEALDWGAYRNNGQMVFSIPPVSLATLAANLEKTFNTTTVRVVGNGEMTTTKIGIVPGAYGYLNQIEMINREDVETLIVGESREWETVEYVRDMVELGGQKALIIMGHADSEDPGMKYCADWLRNFIDEVPVKHIPAGNPLWSPR